MQTKHTSENAARVAARKEFKNETIQIIESGHQDPVAGWIKVFYIESGGDISLIRNWEREVFAGEGAKA